MTKQIQTDSDQAATAAVLAHILLGICSDDPAMQKRVIDKLENLIDLFGERNTAWLSGIGLAEDLDLLLAKSRDDAQKIAFMVLEIVKPHWR